MNWKQKSTDEDEESETFLFDAAANPSKASCFIAKAIALKRHRNENDEMKVLEEAIESSKKKKKKSVAK